MSTNRLKNKNIIITGASSGIGLSVAKLCAERGAHLVLLARRLEKLEEIKRDLEEQFHITVHVHQLDVSKTDEVEAVFSHIIAELGRIDVLLNNAGYGIFRYAHEASIEEIKGMFSVNVVGLMACTNMVLQVMKQQKSGHIINVASIAGKIATPKSSVYSATKHAVLGYSNSLRMELADDHVFVTTVNPGPIATNFFNIADEQGTYVKNVQRYMLQPQFVAKKITDAMLTKTREINLPHWMNAGSVIFALCPRLFERAGKRIFNKK